MSSLYIMRQPCMKLEFLSYETKHVSLQKMIPLDSTNLTSSDQ